MNPAGHVMILASAGSGKTYALTNRYIRLLAHGAKPERIAALTFTRKAAGEFFDEILKKLARAAGDGPAAEKLAAEIAAPALGAADFLRLLRVVTEAMHRLNLGTLDSFFARVVRAFPLELGLGGDFEVLQAHAAQLERRRVLRRMFAHTEGGTARQDFIEAFKRATFGTEEKQLGARLDGFLDEHAEAYLAAPDAAAWGHAERIWPEGCAWLAAAEARKRAAAATELQAALPWATFSDKQRARWENFFLLLPDWAPGAPLPKPVDYVVGNAFKAWPGLTEIMVERKQVPLAPAAGRALRALVSGIIGAELARRLEMTQGMFAVLHGYEEVYDGAVRRAGRLTFADVQRLLRPDAPDGKRILTRDSAAEARLFIDWRLDAQIDHWLLDEFQDTSFGQWSVLRNLIDEAVQDPAEERSFFYVGDVKQAIFAWREGDSRLFREIFDHYNTARPGTIREERLDRSWRSGPAVIAFVNRVLGDGEALARLFPADAAGRWTREWRDHESAQPHLGGYAVLRHAGDEAGRFAETLRIIAETGALERGLSVAVLVQKNSTAAELADYLRREGGLPAVAESDLHVGTDNPLACALLALFRAAAHPGDSAARAQVAMTPLQAVLTAEGCATEDALTGRLLAEIHAAGFERTVETWVRKLELALATDDAFSRERGRQLADAARLFDETGSRDVAEFVQFVERHTVRDADTAAVVRVMTVHKAKGLGFDLVVLPDLEGTRLAARRRGLAMQRARDRSVEWVFDLPPETFHGHDDVLSAHVAAAEADACYEELAVLYVALTRAKRAMYVITEPVGTSQSHNFTRLLQETLGEEWSAGEARWFEAITPPAPTAGPETGLATVAATRVLRRPARTPSEAKTVELPGERLFALEDGGGAVRFGRAVHALLAQVEWGGGPEAARLSAAWRNEGEAGADALACLASPDLAEVWAKPPAARVEAWRERAFEIVLEGAWVTGVFDRVMVTYDGSGRAVRAAVYDFKTDRGTGPDLSRVAARHEGQIAIYRRVVAVLTGLPVASVSAEVVFTGPAKKVALGADT
jgi:ATP-dependent exoDNAse (exonuclease V) beta subunit